MVLKLRKTRHGGDAGHVSVFFMGPDIDHFALNGTLRFTPAEWDYLEMRLEPLAVAIVDDTERDA